MKQFRDTNYYVTEDGRVFYKKERERKLQDVNGALQVMLSIDKMATFHYVAKLVAECYIPNPNNFPHVLHIDGDNFNNHVSNLRWGFRTSKSKKGIKRRRFTKEEIEFIRKNEDRYLQCDLADMFKTSQSYISNLVNWKVNQKRKTH